MDSRPEAAAPAQVAERVTVADGDPCPIHGEPTRLLWLPQVGLYSQCERCVDAFFAWYGAIEAGTKVELRPTTDERTREQQARAEQLNLLE